MNETWRGLPAWLRTAWRVVILWGVIAGVTAVLYFTGLADWLD